MNICDKDHEEIAFNSRECPLCALLSDQAQHVDELCALEKDIKDQDIEIDRLDTQLSMCKDGCPTCPNRLKCITGGENNV